LPRCDGPIHQPPAFEQRAPSRRLDRNANGGVTGNPYYILDRERSAIENTDWFGHRPKLTG
jgi:hypothetical protein